MKAPFFPAACALLATLPAFGADASFRSLDRNDDGRVSQAEFLAAKPDGRHWWNRRRADQGPTAGQRFLQLDANHDGYLSPDELAAPEPAPGAREAYTPSSNTAPHGDTNSGVANDPVPSAATNTTGSTSGNSNANGNPAGEGRNR